MSTSRSINKVILIGNLTRNPSLKETESGSSICTFGLATNSSWKSADGSTQERAEFHNIVAWNKLGEICNQLLKTGMSVYIEGEIRYRQWSSDDGAKHQSTEIKATDMRLLDSKSKKFDDVSSEKSLDQKEEVSSVNSSDIDLF